MSDCTTINYTPTYNNVSTSEEHSEDFMIVEKGDDNVLQSVIDFTSKESALAIDLHSVQEIEDMREEYANKARVLRYKTPFTNCLHVDNSNVVANRFHIIDSIVFNGEIPDSFSFRVNRGLRIKIVTQGRANPCLFIPLCLSSHSLRFEFPDHINPNDIDFVGSILPKSVFDSSTNEIVSHNVVNDVFKKSYRILFNQEGSLCLEYGGGSLGIPLNDYEPGEASIYTL